MTRLEENVRKSPRKQNKNVNNGKEREKMRKFKNQLQMQQKSQKERKENMNGRKSLTLQKNIPKLKDTYFQTENVQQATSTMDAKKPTQKQNT